MASDPEKQLPLFVVGEMPAGQQASLLSVDQIFASADAEMLRLLQEDRRW